MNESANKTASDAKGMVFDIQRMSIHDGPGIRTTVFLKGCPLQCLWCHNPEGRATRPQLAFTPSLCIGCGFCFRRCPNDGHVMVDGEHQLRREPCVECFGCVEQCYSNALEVIGKEMAAEEVLAEVEKDNPFYVESGGGMTLSGGEPLLQFDFTKALLEGARERHIHTCLETCGVGPTDRSHELVDLVDLFLFDCKETDPERHIAQTGASNDIILANLRRLDALGAALVLRCPIVPGINLREDHLQGIVDLAASLTHCQAIHVMPHHRLGDAKRTRLGLPPNDHVIPDMTREEIEAVLDRLRTLGDRLLGFGGKNISTG